MSGRSSTLMSPRGLMSPLSVLCGYLCACCVGLLVVFDVVRE